MKREFKQWWQTIPAISGKRTTNHLSPQVTLHAHKNTKMYGVGNKLDYLLSIQSELKKKIIIIIKRMADAST